METGSHLTSYFILALAIGLFIASLWMRSSLKKEIRKKDEALRMKETEFNELRMLAAGVTHEINNAVTIVIGRADQLARKNDDPQQEKIFNSIKKGCDRIVTSVKGLRQFIYPDTREVETYIDLGKLIEDVMKLTGQRLRNHGIELRLRGVENKFVRGRISQLEQLLTNLLNQSVERLSDLPEKWVQLIAADEQGGLNIYYMDSSGDIGDKISHKQFSEILERNHGHLTVNQNNLVMELSKPAPEKFHI
ncbi:HAMP domain-containing sensor histidine kinase [Peredibacter starrii]|uniref:histidine kinase n=1 Tax=Peredibacter starrii TaxID=28202 RepID=A0AAX4HU56_9BACT|nr:HAMP domain-containing sensor histidine kinase [Peredibacter starrii]WPU66618.1 HAMP domain-containing sensor histidine kinase [Peredibacter starrii]